MRGPRKQRFLKGLDELKPNADFLMLVVGGCFNLIKFKEQILFYMPKIIIYIERTDRPFMEAAT